MFAIFGWIAVTTDNSVTAQGRVYGTENPTFVRKGHTARSQEATEPAIEVDRFRIFQQESSANLWLLDTTIGRTWLWKCPPEGTRGTFGSCSIPKRWIEKE